MIQQTREQQVVTFGKKLAAAVSRKNERRRLCEFDFWINLFLVWSGERPGYLCDADEFFTHERRKPETTLEEQVAKIVRPFGLFVVVGQDDQFLVTRNKVQFPLSDAELGERLGMFAPGGEFANWFRPRWLTEISGVTLGEQITAEFCTADHEAVFSRTVERAASWNQACQVHGLPYRFQASQMFFEAPWSPAEEK